MSLGTEAVQLTRDSESKRPEHAPTRESPAADNSSPLLGGLLSSIGTSGSNGSNSQLMTSSLMRHPASGEIRALVMRRYQQHVGNQRAQRLVAGLHRSSPVQRHCNCGGTCEECRAQMSAPTAPESQVVQAQANDEHPVGPVTAESLRPESSAGQPLDAAVRRSMETHFGTDFRQVRVHADAPASRAANSIHADAYTIGRDVYFGEGHYRPETAEGSHLLAHELTHVQQQAAGVTPVEVEASPKGDILIGQPNDDLEREAEAQADNFTRKERETSPVKPDSSGAVRRSDWKSLTDNPIANTIASGARKGINFIASQIETLAPGAIKFFRNIRDYFKSAMSKGVDGLFGGILSSFREKGIVATLEGMVGSFASGALQAVGGFVSGHCAAMGKLAEYLLDLTTRLGGAALDEAKKGFEAIRGPLENLWTEYGAPPLDWVKRKLKGVWKEVEDTANKFWNFLQPLRDGLTSVWNEVTDFLIESRRSFNEWLEWFVPKAIDAWEEVKAKIKPYMEHVKTAAKVAGAVALLLSPAGPFVLVGAAVYGLYQGAKVLWDKWGKGLTHSAREWWANEGIPYVQGKLKDFRSKVDSLKQRVQSGLQQLHDIFMKVLGALGVLSFLTSVKNAIDTVTRNIEAFKAKLDHQLEEWSQKLQALIAKADPFFQQIKEVFRQSLLIAVFGPLAILDEGVWSTVKKFTGLVLKTPCLRELGGLLRLPSLLQRLEHVRSGIKQAWEVIKNPDPLLEKLKLAIAPMIAKIEPLVRARVSSMFTDREILIQVSVWHYLSDSLSALRADWWPQLKKMGGDLLWPWPEVAKDFMPMLEDFGGAIGAVFNLEFSEATDKYLSGMKRFNGIAGALSGWILVASVLIGAGLGALGFTFGPAGVATVGAGATAGLAFAEQLGMGLLIVAAATEAAVIEKADFDLRFQNPRIKDQTERDHTDQEDCKKIAGSLISLITIGALMLLGSLASKFAKFLWGLVEDVPIVRDVSALLKDVKKTVGDFSLKDEGKAAPKEATPEGRPAQSDSAVDPDTTAKPGDFTPEQVDAANKKLAERINDPKNVREIADPESKYDFEVDLEDGQTYRRKKDGTWCLFRNPIKCGLEMDPRINQAADQQKQKLEAEKASEQTTSGPSFEWPPKNAPEPPKPPIDAPNGAEWRYREYRYKKYQENPNIKESELPTFPEYTKRYITPGIEGGRPGRAGGEAHQTDVQATLDNNPGARPEAVGNRVPDIVGKPGQSMKVRGDTIKPVGKGRVIVESDKTVYGGTIPDSEARAQVRDFRKADPDATLVVTDYNDPSAKPLIYQPGTQPPPPGPLGPNPPISVKVDTGG